MVVNEGAQRKKLTMIDYNCYSTTNPSMFLLLCISQATLRRKGGD